MDFRALPKIELHAHLSGSVSRKTLHEIWKAKRDAGETDLADPMVVMPDGKHDYDLHTFFPLFSSYIYQLLTDESSIRQATTSLLREFQEDGVVYLELRTTPRATPHLTPRAQVEAIISAIRDFEASNDGKMHTRLILSIDRRHDLPTAMSIVDLAVSLSQSRDQDHRQQAEHQDGSGNQAVVVGIDLCGDPTAKPNGQVSIFTPAFEAATAAGLYITVHFAEAEASGSKAEIETLLSWRPHRLGHVIWEDAEAKQEIADRGLCLELCLSCNVHAGMVSGGFEGHHLGYWMGVIGPKIALSTDDVGVFGSALSNEYRLAAAHFKLDDSQVRALARQGIDGIFGGEAEKNRLRNAMWT